MAKNSQKLYRNSSKSFKKPKNDQKMCKYDDPSDLQIALWVLIGPANSLNRLGPETGQ